MQLHVILSITYFLIFTISKSNSESYKITDQIYMDVALNSNPMGKITFGLFGEIAPKTVKNFKTLALYGIEGGKSYKGSKFLISINKIMILAGDILYNNGSGSISIFGKYFPDENFQINADSAGLLVMANNGKPGTNGCMFFITTMPAPWLKGKNVIFGKVLKGHKIVHRIERLKTDYRDRLIDNVTIIHCGEIKAEAFFDDHKNYELTLWAWIKAGWFPLCWSFAILGFFHYILSKLNSLQSFKED